jgi:hypothetical protein
LRAGSACPQVVVGFQTFPSHARSHASQHLVKDFGKNGVVLWTFGAADHSLNIEPTAPAESPNCSGKSCPEMITSDTVESNVASGAYSYAGGIYIATAATVSVDPFTLAHVINNTAAIDPNIDGSYFAPGVVPRFFSGLKRSASAHSFREWRVPCSSDVGTSSHQLSSASCSFR